MPERLWISGTTPAPTPTTSRSKLSQHQHRFLMMTIDLLHHNVHVLCHLLTQQPVQLTRPHLRILQLFHNLGMKLTTLYVHIMLLLHLLYVDVLLLLHKLLVHDLLL